MDLETNNLEMEDPLRKYNFINKIGKGKYGKVYRALFKAEDQTAGVFAIKKMRLLTQEQEGIAYNILREISALKMLKHQNIIKLKEVIHHRSLIYMVMEYAETDLSNFIRKFGGNSITIFQIQNILGQLLTGLQYMHQNNICHRDLKPENILISPDGLIKISDFGLSRYMSPTANQLYTTEVVTQVYRAPELLMDISSYNTAIDIWSVGCIFAELIIQIPFFVAETPLQTLNLIFQLLGKPNESEWPELTNNKIFQNLDCMTEATPIRIKHSFPSVENIIGQQGLDLLQKMLMVNPSKRITATEALEHPFFSTWM